MPAASFLYATILFQFLPILLQSVPFSLRPSPLSIEFPLFDNITEKPASPTSDVAPPHSSASHLKQYDPTWESLDTHPLPQWYEDAKFGIFVHWGVYSVPSFRSEWFWSDWQIAHYNDCVQFMQQNYPPAFTYADFAPQFHAELFNPDQWSEIFAASGAKYLVLTSKHHEGFTMWPSKYSFNWNAMDVGPMRDLVGDLASAVRAKGLRFGLYHSLLEWFNPLFQADQANGYRTQDFVALKTLPELYEIVERYKPEVIWSDGDWGPPDYKYWNATEFIAWLYNSSPVRETVLVNDRWGGGVLCKHGDIFTCADEYVPGHLVKHKWEGCHVVDGDSWGYRRNMHVADLRNTSDIVELLVATVSCGGNMLLNVGPTSDGRIDPVFEERLRAVGAWLAVNGEGIYGTRPWSFAQNDSRTTGVWYTVTAASSSPDSIEDTETLYAHVLLAHLTLVFDSQTNPRCVYIDLGSVNASSMTRIHLLGHEQDEIPFTPYNSGGIRVELPLEIIRTRIGERSSSPTRVTSLIEDPHAVAWVLRIEHALPNPSAAYDTKANFRLIAGKYLRHSISKIEH